MKKAPPLHLIAYYTLFLISVLLFTACEKVPGHVISGGGSTTSGGATGGNSGGTTGGTTGGTFSLGTGTITFRINNGATQTWTQPAYITGLGTTPTTGVLAFSTIPSTLITSGPNDPKLFLTNSFSICFEGLTPGKYKMGIAGSGITFGGASYSAAATTEIATVTSESINITSTSMGTATGNAKGTFDGYMQNLATFDSVRVSGTFDVHQ